MKRVDLTKEGSAVPPIGLHYEALYGSAGSATRALWEQVFTEDTAAFLDYYYREKIMDAHIHVLKDESGSMISMVHANPYDVMVHGVRRSTYYMVGVATAQPYRHRGCMAFLLQKAILQAKREGCPFVFLMPADAAIYEPFGFRYGGTISVWERSAALKARMTQNRMHAPSYVQAAEWDHVRLSAYTEADAAALAAYAGKTLAERYDTYCVHDEAYFGRLSRELASENGGIYLLWKREQKETHTTAAAGKQRMKSGAAPAGEGVKAGNQMKETLCGYFCYACEAEEYLQEVVADREAEALFVEKSRQERIMFLSLEETCPYGRTYFPEIV